MTSQLKNDEVELIECTLVGFNCSILTGLKMFLIPTTPHLVAPYRIHSSSEVIFIKTIRSPVLTVVGETASQRLGKKMWCV